MDQGLKSEPEKELDIEKGVNIVSNPAPAANFESQMHNQIQTLCKELLVSSTRFNASKWLRLLNNYIQVYKRLSYFEITNFIFSLHDEEKYSTLLSNLLIAAQSAISQVSIEEKADISKNANRVVLTSGIPEAGTSSETTCSTEAATPSETVTTPASAAPPKIPSLEESESFCSVSTQQMEPDELYRLVSKFLDHVQLAHRQEQLFTEKGSAFNSMIDQKVRDSSVKMTKELTSQLISLVAIFTALSFIIFGGINSLSSIFSTLDMTQHSILSTLIVSIAWAFCLLNLLFLFMYFILRIVYPKNARSEDSYISKERNLIQRFPLFFLLNYFLFSCFLICSTIFFLTSNNIGFKVFSYITSHTTISFFIILALVILIIIAIGFILYRFYNKKE